MSGFISPPPATRRPRRLFRRELWERITTGLIFAGLFMLMQPFSLTLFSYSFTVILAGMEAPPNYGRDYIVSFHKIYPALAAKYRVALVPFLLQGAHQIVLPHFDVPAILDVLRHHQRVSLFAAPTMLTRLAHAPEVAGADLADLKTIYYGGGPMYVADLEKALGLFGPRLYQLFGQGESPMTITGLNQRLHADSAHPRWRERLGSCGVARSGVLARVVDEDDREVPPGEVGEIVTKSDCVMEGYWENPAANAETLRGGWLHTRDLGSMDEDGFLTLRDRSKDMIISGGSNIYPREIEEVLLRHPAVAECSVVGRPHPEWGEEVVAFIVSAAHVSPEDLDLLCRENIARFKRPREYRFVDSLPKNHYGKVLKTELRAQLAYGLQQSPRR